MSGTRSDVKAFNHDQGDDAAVVGPSRSRIRQILVFGNSAGALTIKDGSGGTDLLEHLRNYQKQEFVLFLI